ncbi:MAG: hypothetical protein Q7K20_03500 [Polaromonas sp.]|nr:hypothetical protein [Polaromonas sp.]
MRKSNAKLWVGAALSALLLAGCGGGGGGIGATDGVVSPPAPTTMEQTITDVFAFISKLIASNDENTEPIDINPLTLAADDASEPRPLP